MAKYDVTKELAETIKNTRIANHVIAKDVAEHINKSPAYISKLEKQEIKTIDEDTLTSIFCYIFHNNQDDIQAFYDSTLNEILKSLDIHYSDDEIESQVWFDNFDTVRRLIPLPEELIDDINFRMEVLNLSIHSLCEKINENEDILPDITNDDKHPFNVWQAKRKENEPFFFIKMKVSDDEIDSILKKEKNSSNYVMVLAIVHNLTKIESNLCYGHYTKDTRQAIEYLNKFKFFSLTERRKLANQVKTVEELEGLFSAFDKENAKYLEKILKSFQFASDMDLRLSNKYLSAFSENLKWDNGFIMKLIGMDYHSLGDLSFSNKKSLLERVSGLIKEYASLSEEQKRAEFY